MKHRRSRDRSKERGAPPVAADAAPSTRVDVGWSPWRQRLVAAGVLALALSALLYEIAWQGRIFAAPDFQSPSDFATAGRAALASGEYPLWNPYIFLGMPSFGSLAFTPWVFPPSEVLRVVGALPGAPPLFWLLFYFWLAGFGVFVLMHALRCGFWPSLLAAVAFMLTPHVMSMGVFGHGSKLASVALLPWLLWSALGVRHARRPWVWTGVLALLLGLQLLRGHPQIAFYALLMLALWGLVEIAGSVRSPLGRRTAGLFAARMVAAVVLGVGLSAVLLLPVRAYAPDSIRGASEEEGGAGYDYATAWSQSLREVTTFAVPSAMGFGEGTYVGSMPFTNFPHYLGQATLLFGVAALVMLRGRWIVFLVVLLSMSLLVSFGRHMPLVYNLFYEFLPYFDRFRVPVMILVLFQLGASVLAGLGCAALFGVKPHFVGWRRVPSRRSARTLLVGAVVAAALVLAATLPWSESLASRVAASPRVPPAGRNAYAEVARDLLSADGVRVAGLLAVSAALVFLMWRRRLPADATGALLVLLLLVDLGAVDRRMVRPENTWPGLPTRVTPPHPPEQATPLLEFLRARSDNDVTPVRVLPTGALFQSNQWMAHGIQSVGGYHPAKLSRYQALFESGALAEPRMHDVLGVQFYVSAQPLSGMGAAVYSGADGYAYANPDAFPRAWLVARSRVVEPRDCVAALRDPGFDARREVLLTSASRLESSQTEASGEVRIEAYSANRVALGVQSSTPAFVVLSEAYHRNWRARVNGEPASVHAAQCLLRAVPVPAGASRVELEFVDPALRAGLGVSLGALMLVVLLIALGTRYGVVRTAAKEDEG